MRFALALTAVAVLFAAGCSSPQPPDPKEPSPEWKSELPESAELAGMEVEESTDGPWAIRRAKAKRPDGPAGSSRELRALGGGAAPATRGAAPAEGAAFSGADAGDEEDASRRFEFEEGVEAPEAESAPAAPVEDPGAGPMPSPEPPSGPGRDKARERVDRLHADARQSAPPALKAGTTDDNADYEEFLAFLAKWGDRADTAGRYDVLDVRDRRHVRVVNRDGRPVPGARVQVVDLAADRVVLRGTTYGDGRVPYYPRLDGGGASVPVAEGAPDALLVEATHGDRRERLRWDGRGEEFVVTLDVAEPVAEPIRLDVLFLIDTTGSMGDEIERIKASLLSMTQKLRSLEREFDLRYGAVLYRDLGDAYVTARHAFTGDIRAFDEALQAVRASGGGDKPESLNQGMAESIGRMDWRDGAAKVMFLIADAAPHMDYQGDVTYGESVKVAVAKGIRIHSVAASGLKPIGSLVFRQIAQFTRGKFIFIEYGGDVAKSGAAHGVKGAGKSNNLDDILFAQIRDEVATWGRD